MCYIIVSYQKINYQAEEMKHPHRPALVTLDIPPVVTRVQQQEILQVREKLIRIPSVEIKRIL